MKKKNKMMGFLVVITCVLFLGGLVYSSNSGFMSEWGKYLKNDSTKSSRTNYAKGKNATVTYNDIERAKQFFVLSGETESEAESKAIDYVLKQEALYQDAIKNGYTVSDEDVWKYLEELKQIVNSAENKEDFTSVMNQFDSEEAYWNFLFQVYKKDLPIRNYVKDLEKHFTETKNFSNQNNNDVSQSWEEYFEQFKKQLVEKENYKF